MVCDGCGNGCIRDYPFRRCIHDIGQLMFVCPEFGRLMFSTCPVACADCPGLETGEA